jgi:hypothetical protein
MFRIFIKKFLRFIRRPKTEKLVGNLRFIKDNFLIISSQSSIINR